MKRQELAKSARRQIQWLKSVGVPKLMMAQDVAALEKILEGVDYSTYIPMNKPRFKMDELELHDEEDLLATTFYVWGNPYVKYGDGYFFKNSYNFGRLLVRNKNSWSNRLSSIIYADEPSVIYNISRYGESGLTLEQLLGLEEVA